MAHNHAHGHHHHGHHHHHSTKNIRAAFFLNFGFTIFEIVGGLLTNSVAILADAVHDLGDSLSLGLAWFLQYYSGKESDQHYTYGYGRFSLLGALINAIVLIFGSLWILSEAVPRLLAPEESNAPGIIGFALVGVAVNGAAALRLKGGLTMNERLITWHLLEDALGWVAVLIAGIVMLFVEAPIIDPILAVLFTLYVLFNVVKGFRSTISLFLQRTPNGVNVESIVQQFQQIKGVRDSHHTHLWSLDGDRNVLTTHLVISKSANRADILRIKQTSQRIARDLKVKHLTIEIEYENEDCHMKEVRR